MRSAHTRERAVGIEHYVSDADGVGGRLRATPEAFRVRELEAFDTEPVDAADGAYPHLVVRATLREWDTNDFAKRISDALSMSRERVSWAGTKDKHAVTTQLFSLDGVAPEDLPEVDGAELTVVGRAGRPVLFGDLAGNAFEIRVTDPDRPANAETITEQLRAFGDGDVAVPNYFGQQRFGSRRPVTHEVGLALARDSPRDAVLAYLGNPRETEPADTRRARERIETAVAEAPDGDDHDPPESVGWATLAAETPRKLGFERSMLHALAEGEDYLDALRAVPSNLQALFVHAAQSFLFNRILSRRLERGLPFTRPVAGDVVCFADADAPADRPLPDTDRTTRVTEDRVAGVTRHCERGRAFVTAPLLGTDTDLADGDPGEIERAALEAVDLEPADFDLPGEFGSTGDRRAIAVALDPAIERSDDDLSVSFALPKGSYATVVLREYLKVDPMEMG
jgi:tRNA pseudouridine13 synthase